MTQKLKKTVYLFILAGLLPLAASAQMKVGVMSPENVLDALPETDEVQAQMENYMQERQESFQNQYQGWIEEVTAFNERAEAGELSETEQATEEQRLAERQEELNSLQQSMQQQIQQRQNELFTPLLNRVEQAIAEVSEEMGLELVINKNTNTGDPIVYYTSQRGVDITQNVIEKLTQN